MTSSKSSGVLVDRSAGRGRLRACLGLAALSVAWALAACSSSGPKPARVEGSITAAAGLNPSISNRPSPLLLRIYELRSPTAFNQADFMSLYQSDQATLAADLVVREELMLQPGEIRPFSKQLSPETRFIGVIAVYRNLERATWRAVVPVPPGKTHRFSVRADSLALSATLLP
jgi:type VI secretion system protein VasD